DRRYLSRTIAATKVPPSGAASADTTSARAVGSPASIHNGIRLTPFLDRLKDDSVYFENFFTNAVQTAHGLFASFCSYYPSQGPSAMKTHYTHDYLCLPTLLSRAGYRTEMVIGQHRDLN